MNDLVWYSFRHSEGALLLLRPQSLQGLKCPVSRPQPCIPFQSWKTLSIQRKLWSGCRPHLILQDRAWGVKDVSKRIGDTILSANTCFSPPLKGFRTCATSFEHMRDHMRMYRVRAAHVSDYSSSPRSVIRIVRSLASLFPILPAL